MNELVFILAPLLTAFILAFLYFAAPKENTIIKVFFLFGVMIFIIIGNAATVTMANVGNSTATYNEVITLSNANLFAAVFTVIVFVALFFVLYLNAIFKKGMQLNQKINRQTHDYEL